MSWLIYHQLVTKRVNWKEGNILYACTVCFSSKGLAFILRFSLRSRYVFIFIVK